MIRPVHLALAAALAVMAAPAAEAKPFTLLIYEADSELALRTDQTDRGAAYWGGYGQFAKEAQAAGILRGGSALAIGDGASRVIPAEAASGAPRLSGYFQIDVADMETAAAWAAKLPAAATGAVEVREGYPAPGM